MDIFNINMSISYSYYNKESDNNSKDSYDKLYNMAVTINNKNKNPFYTVQGEYHSNDIPAIFNESVPHIRNKRDKQDKRDKRDKLDKWDKWDKWDRRDNNNLHKQIAQLRQLQRLQYDKTEMAIQQAVRHALKDMKLGVNSTNFIISKEMIIILLIGIIVILILYIITSRK